jgi:MOSC domain-containing protein YiiM
VAWQGRQVRTAIFKDPVTGPKFVGRINIAGDHQAYRLAHGGEHRALFVYQIESYRCWEEERRGDFAYGQFGGNVTVEGLSDDEVCIGDRYRIGGALFEVTQPRVTSTRCCTCRGDGVTTSSVRSRSRRSATAGRARSRSAYRETNPGSDDGDAPTTPPPAWAGFRRLRVDSVSVRAPR